jgi:hypothetical protein
MQWFWRSWKCATFTTYGRIDRQTDERRTHFDQKSSTEIKTKRVVLSHKRLCKLVADTRTAACEASTLARMFLYKSSRGVVFQSDSNPTWPPVLWLADTFFTLIKNLIHLKSLDCSSMGSDVYGLKQPVNQLRRSKMFQPIRGQGGHLRFEITSQKNTT